MSAQNTDKFKDVTPNTGWQLGGEGIPNASVDNFALVSALGIPTGTGVVITIDRVDNSGNKTPEKMERIVGVISGNNVIDCIRGYEGTAQAHSGGAVVEILVSAKLWNDAMAGIRVEHNQDGTHNIPNKTIQEAINAPRGFLINGKIVVTDTGSEIKVEIKTLSDEDPSLNNPVFCRIGNTVRSITSALSRVWADGTNYLNMGSAELANKEVDLFPKLVWNTNLSAVDLIVSRIPFGDLISEYTDSLTGEKGYLYSGTKPAVTDEVENIGRFAATLSAGAGYTWSVPTYDASNLIQRPIFETRVLIWTPVYTGFSGTPTVTNGKYKLVGDLLHTWEWGVTGTSNSTSMTISFPFTPVTGARHSAGRITDNGSVLTTPGLLYNIGSNPMNIYKDIAGGSFTASGTKGNSLGYASFTI